MSYEPNMLQLARNAYTQAPESRPDLTEKVRRRILDGRYETPAHREQLARMLLLLFHTDEEVMSGCL